MTECRICGGSHAHSATECWQREFERLLRQPQIEPSHPHYRQARAAVLAEIDRLNDGGPLLSGEQVRLHDTDLVIPLATKYAARILDLLDAEQIAIGRSDLHAAVGHLAVQAWVGRLAAAGLHPDDRRP